MRRGVFDNRELLESARVAHEKASQLSDACQILRLNCQALHEAHYVADYHYRRAVIQASVLVAKLARLDVGIGQQGSDVQSSKT